MNDRKYQRDISSDIRTAPLTCAVDGLAHAVSDEAAAAGIASRTGTYSALCGHMVHAAALICATGRPCPRCALQVQTRRTASVPQDTRGTRTWHERLRRLLGRGSASMQGGS
jgi:hypothetical protein